MYPSDYKRLRLWKIEKTFQVDPLVFAFPFLCANSSVLLILIQEQRVQNAGIGVFEVIKIIFL